MRYDRRTTQGRWRSILAAVGVEDKLLNGRNGPCPICGGTDRFRFLDTEGSGSWVCNQCGSGDGMHLVMAHTGLQFKDAVEKVRALLPQARESAPAKPRDALPRLREMWKQSHAVAEGDPVARYLEARGVWDNRVCDLRYLPVADYYHNGEKIGRYPAMLALVRDKDGEPSTLHVTYLGNDGRKANVPSPKKVISAMGPGPHIELFPRGDHTTLDVAEGIETAMAVHRLRSCPAYATISAQGMRDFVIPSWVETLNIWADNDENFTGQAAAYALANRASIEGFEVFVHVPRFIGTDWADKGV